MKKTAKGILPLVLMLVLNLTMVLPTFAAMSTEAETKAAVVGILSNGVDTANSLKTDDVPVLLVALETSEQKPESVSVSSTKELKTALADKTVKAISIESIGNPVVVTGEMTIPEGVIVTVNCGSDFYIEGILTNNGTINVMGADSISVDFINYSVMSVQNGGQFINNGGINLLASVLENTDDYGPIGGQLRLNSGTLTNQGTVFLEAGSVNTHGGVAVVIDGTFTNDALVVVEGFFLHVEKGVFINNNGAVVINNSHIFVEEAGTFTNNGTLSGNEPNQ